MKYIKTFEYQIYTTSGTLGKMYSGRFTGTLSRHCMMLDRRDIEYEIFVDEDEFEGKQDVVFIVIKDDYKQEYFTIFKSLGFNSINAKQIKNLTKFNSIQDYLKTKKLDENEEWFDLLPDPNYILIHPVDSKGEELEDNPIMEIKDDEAEELKNRKLINYVFDYSTGRGWYEYCEDDVDEIEEFLDLIRRDEYKAAKKYNL